MPALRQALSPTSFLVSFKFGGMIANRFFLSIVFLEISEKAQKSMESFFKICVIKRAKLGSSELSFANSFWGS
jgi:hypothetical protein